MVINVHMFGAAKCNVAKCANTQNVKKIDNTQAKGDKPKFRKRFARKYGYKPRKEQH